MNNFDRKTRECVVCGVSGMAPDVMPYLGRDGHAWAHPQCAKQAYEARLSEPIPEMTFSQFSEVQR